MNFQMKNFSYRTKRFGDFVDQITAGSLHYLRSLATERPSEKAANLTVDFPELALDFKLPPQLDIVTRNAHSSPLRISGPVTMWLHYDVRKSFICQTMSRSCKAKKKSCRSWRTCSVKSTAPSVSCSFLPRTSAASRLPQENQALPSTCSLPISPDSRNVRRRYSRRGMFSSSLRCGFMRRHRSRRRARLSTSSSGISRQAMPVVETCMVIETYRHMRREDWTLPKSPGPSTDCRVSWVASTLSGLLTSSEIKH